MTSFTRIGRIRFWLCVILSFLFSLTSKAGETSCDPCEPVQNSPCESVQQCDPCEPVQTKCRQKGGWEWDMGGWAASGVYTNSHGSQTNGPMHSNAITRTDFNLSQVFVYGEGTYTTRSGFRVGGRADLMYGTDYDLFQSFGDRTFDGKWLPNEHGYAASMAQLFAQFGYEKLNVRAGKFITPIGWESSLAPEKFFYSNSMLYWAVEPSTQSGVMAEYELSDRLTVGAGWVTGMDCSLDNRFGDRGFLGTIEYKLTKKSTLYYAVSQTEAPNGLWDRNSDPTAPENWRLGDDGLLRQNTFLQSMCWEWTPTDRFAYVFQYDVRNDGMVDSARSITHTSAFGFNNHFLYQLNDKWKAGLRLEWFRDNGEYGYLDTEASDYFQTTFGLNWSPCDNFILRPEVRYDRVIGGDARPFGDNRRDQISGGVGMSLTF
ncbi:MAG: outer membrane beta-barrel protein [Thermoguttaceae bacterium]